MSAHFAASPRSFRLRLPELRRPALNKLLAVAAAAALLSAGWLWLRDSSLVSVERVAVSGASGSQAGAIRSALESSASDMTTLNVDVGALRDAVARFPLVRDLEISPDVPHGLRIRVIERVPVGAIRAGGVTVAVAEDGTILRGMPAGDLPRIVSRVSPGGARVSDRRTQVKVAVLAAAPRHMRARILRVTLGPQGLIAVLASGPRLRFGDGSRLTAKWIAATRVLRDPAAASAAYVDLRVPERPAAGGLTVEQGGTQVQASAAPSPVAPASPAQAVVPTDVTAHPTAPAQPPAAQPATTQQPTPVTVP